MTTTTTIPMLANDSNANFRPIDGNIKLEGGKANYGNSDTVYIQRSSQTIYKQSTDPAGGSTLTAQGAGGSLIVAPPNSPTMTVLLPTNNNNGAGYKRGTIIASATTSPTRGYRLSASSNSPSSQYHRSKALGVTSSASSSVDHNNPIVQLMRFATRRMPDYGWKSSSISRTLPLLLLFLLVSISHNLLHPSQSFILFRQIFLIPM